MPFKNIVYLHNSQVTYLQICLLTKICLQLPNRSWKCFWHHLWTCAESWKFWVAKWAGFLLRSNKMTLLSYFSYHTVNKPSFHGLLSAMVFTFLCFLFLILLFKWLPSVVLKCYVVFLSPRRLWCTLNSVGLSLFRYDFVLVCC